MFGSSELYDALNINDITSLLDTYLTQPALFSAEVIPQDFTGNKSINFYRIGLYGGGLDYNDYTYSIHCRGASKTDSETIAEAVRDGINRVSYSDYYIVADVLQNIPPADDTDNYNTPLEVALKQR